MSATFDAESYEMLIDEDTFAAFSGGEITWLENTNWRAQGMDPTLFPDGMLPFKQVLIEDGRNQHTIACKYYALAHRKGYAKGPPRYLITLKMEPSEVLKAQWVNLVKVDPRAQTLAFLEKITPENYPGLKDAVLHPITEEN
eukprot:9111564-Prorocentrum_lima.AAC.1